MLFWLVSLFVLTPLVELVILVYIGMAIGALYTVLIVVITGIAGAALAKSQGLAALARIRSSIEQGIIPSSELFDGVLILAGGLFLIAPGVITDIVGFAMLIPQTRRFIGKRIRSSIRHRVEKGEIQYWEMR
jgi:UPF0716 protein FxsA